MPPLRHTTCLESRLTSSRSVFLALLLSWCLPAAQAQALALAQTQAQPAAAIAQGKRIWQQRCTDCHALDTDETGPRHRGVFGRRAGSLPGYDYSRALRRSAITWDAGSLDRWLSDPESFIPGQNMDVRLTRAADRAAVIAYLQSLSPAGASPASAPAQNSRAAPGTPRR
ncbi:MAG: c-type cytochrome [Duganella sp.]